MSLLILGSIYTRKKELELQELIEKLESTIAGDDELSVRTELVGGVGKYGRLLGWLYIGDSNLSLNEQMIEEGYAHAYDGGTKDMDLEALREIRRAHGTLV
jgi:micrococcal nuclease